MKQRPRNFASLAINTKNKQHLLKIFCKRRLEVWKHHFSISRRFLLIGVPWQICAARWERNKRENHNRNTCISADGGRLWLEKAVGSAPAGSPGSSRSEASGRQRRRVAFLGGSDARLGSSPGIPNSWVRHFAQTGARPGWQESRCCGRGSDQPGSRARPHPVVGIRGQGAPGVFAGSSRGSRRTEGEARLRSRDSPL